MDLPRDTDQVFVPASPNSDRSGLNIETRRLADGGAPVGLAFTSVEALVGFLGDYQPWISITMRDYVNFLRGTGIMHVQVDPAAEDGLWRWSGATLAEHVREGS